MRTTFDGLIIQSEIFLKKYLWEKRTHSSTSDCELKKNEETKWKYHSVALDLSHSGKILTSCLQYNRSRKVCVPDASFPLFCGGKRVIFEPVRILFWSMMKKNETWRVPRQNTFFAWHDLTRYFSFDVVWIEKSMRTGNFMHVYGFWFLGS